MEGRKGSEVTEGRKGRRKEAIEGRKEGSDGRKQVQT